jgi:drug/metabolite transporter (DMT)-like permease
LTSRAALVALHTAVALFGLAALFGKWIALPAIAIVLGRTAVASVTLVLVVKWRRQRPHRGDHALFVNGAILAMHWVSFFAAVQVANVAIALLGYAVFPVFVLLLSHRLRVDISAWREWTTALLATGGLAALAPSLSWDDGALRGLGFALVSAFTFAWLTLRNRALVASRGALGIALWQNVFATACLLPIAAIALRGIAWPRPIDIGLLIVLGTVCTGLSHTLFIASMRRVSAHTASIVAALEPVYGIALAALLLREVPDARTIAGGILIVGAAIVASRDVTGIGDAVGVSVASRKEGTK